MKRITIDTYDEKQFVLFWNIIKTVVDNHVKWKSDPQLNANQVSVEEFTKIETSRCLYCNKLLIGKQNYTCDSKCSEAHSVSEMVNEECS